MAYSTFRPCYIIDTIHRKLRPSVARICSIPVSQNNLSSPKTNELSSNRMIMCHRVISMMFSCSDPAIMSDMMLSLAHQRSITRNLVWHFRLHCSLLVDSLSMQKNLLPRVAVAASWIAPAHDSHHHTTGMSRKKIAQWSSSKSAVLDLQCLWNKTRVTPLNALYTCICHVPQQHCPEEQPDSW